MSTLRIGEVAKLTGISTATLRLWESQGLIRPTRSNGGIRRYSQEDVDLIRRIVEMREIQGLNPRTVAHFLNSGNPPEHVSRPQPTNPESIIARGLRQRRKDLGLTLKEVSDRTGVSISHLSAIERNQQHPSFSTLLSLTQCYGIMIQDLISNRSRDGFLVRAHERPVFPAVEQGVVIEQLTVGEHRIESQIFTIPPGAESGGFYFHRGEEFILILSGSVTFWLGSEDPYDLQTGDSLCFPSSIQHRWANRSDSPAQALWCAVHDSDPPPELRLNAAEDVHVKVSK